MKRVTPILVASALVFAALVGATGCDIIYNTPPITAGEASGIFDGLVTGTNDAACGAFLQGQDPSFDFGFENFDKKELHSVDVVVGAPPPNTAFFSAFTAFIAQEGSNCPFTSSGEITYEFAPPAKAPDASQRVEKFVPVVIHSAFIPAGQLCTGPPLCDRFCGPTIPESRLLDVRMFCTVNDGPAPASP